MPSNRPPSKYDPADFIIPAQDAKGHSERVYASIQPGHSRQLDIIREGRRFPFRTKGDIIRWCIKEGISKLELMEDIPSVSAQVDVITNIMREEQFHAEWEQTFDQMQGVINRHMANGAYGEVRRVIAQVRAAIDRMPDGYWKDRYMDTLEGRFETALEAAEAMSRPAGVRGTKKKTAVDQAVGQNTSTPGHRLAVNGGGPGRAGTGTGTGTGAGTGTKAVVGIRLVGGGEEDGDD